jgi:hypothetical protein
VTDFLGRFFEPNDNPLLPVFCSLQESTIGSIDYDHHLITDAFLLSSLGGLRKVAISVQADERSQTQITRKVLVWDFETERARKSTLIRKM